jgi:hypothetical protein
MAAGMERGRWDGVDPIVPGVPSAGQWNNPLTILWLTLALILTFSPGEKEQRRCLQVARGAGARLQCRVVVVILCRPFRPEDFIGRAGSWASSPGFNIAGFQPQIGED